MLLNTTDCAHVFETTRDCIFGGYCFKCRKKCTIGGKAIDLLVAGFPCRPFTRMRSNKKDVPIEEHDGFEASFSDLLEYLKVRHVRGFILENVKGFADRVKELGPSYLEVMVEKLEALGYAVLCVNMLASTWAEFSRDRIYLIGCSKEWSHRRCSAHREGDRRGCHLPAHQLPDED